MTAPFRIIREVPPLPPSRSCPAPIYHFARMKPGDAFDAPRDMGADKFGKDRRLSSVQTSARAWAKRHNPDTRFSVRCIDDQTVRCRRDK